MKKEKDQKKKKKPILVFILNQINIQFKKLCLYTEKAI